MTSRRITDTDRRAGRALRGWREERGLSRSALAKKLGVTNALTIKSWEDGTARPLKFKVALHGITGWDWDNPPTLFPRSEVRDALERADWVQAKAARLLGISRPTLVKRMKALDIHPQLPERTRLVGASPTPSGKWRAQGHINGTTRYLGTYDTEEEAHAAFMEAKRQAEAGDGSRNNTSDGPQVGDQFRYEGRARDLRGVFVEVQGVRANGRLVVSPIGGSSLHRVSLQTLAPPPFRVGDQVVHRGGKGQGAVLDGGVFKLAGFRDGRKAIIERPDGTRHTVDPAFLSPLPRPATDPLGNVEWAAATLQEWLDAEGESLPEEAVEIAVRALRKEIAVRRLYGH